MPKNIPVTKKIAILLVSLGTDLAAELLKSLPDNEMRKVARAMKELGKVDQNILPAIIDDFLNLLEQPNTQLQGGYSNTKKILTAAFPKEFGSGWIDDILDTDQLSRTIDEINEKDLFFTIKNEHPQTKCLILAYASSEKSAQVLRRFQVKEQSEILIRLANLKDINQDMMTEVNDFLLKSIKQKNHWQTKVPGGLEKVVGILSNINPALEESILEQLEERDLDLANQIREKLFTFDNLDRVQSADFQKLITTIKSSTLSIALKGANNKILELFYNNMSSRSANLLREEINLLPPTRLSDVEKARKEIIEQVMTMVDQGKIELIDNDDEYV